MLTNQNFHKFFKTRKIVAKNSKICPKNTCLLPPKNWARNVENEKRKPKRRIISIYHRANFLAKKNKINHFFHFKIKYIFFLEISSLSKTLPCRPGISEMTIYTNW